MKFKICLGVLIAIILSSCITSSKITGSWVDQKRSPKYYSSVLVAALTNNMVARSTVETELASSLQSCGVASYKSFDEFPPTLTKDSLDKQMLSSRVREKKIEGILSISLIRKEENEKYVPGAYPPVVVYGHRHHFWVYYNYWYPYFYNPGYYVTEKVYYIETNFYDSVTEELIWTAQSRTYNPADLSSFSKDFAKLIVDKLKKDGIIQRSSTVAKNN